MLPSYIWEYPQEGTQLTQNSSRVPELSRLVIM